MGRLIPLGHSHTGEDITVSPSTSDLNVFNKERKLKRHWIFSTQEGWAKAQNVIPRPGRLKILRNRGANPAVRFTVSRSPNFNPKDKSPMEQALHWKFGVPKKIEE